MKKRRSVIGNILLVLVFVVGLSLLLYPTVSDYINDLHQSRAISVYAEQVAHLDKEKYTALWDAARAYNESILDRTNAYLLSEEQAAAYNDLLNVSGDGVMGYIEIPAIGCMLPIYHGVEEEVLQKAIGHLEWTSLPAGGESTHCVVSGHRGLPSAKLFTDLDMLAVGDVFLLRVLDEILTYEVDQILIVEPHESEALLITEGADECTLVTCTPYGVNTHRLLVRGHRIENAKEARIIRVTADAIQVEPLIVAPIVAAPMLLVLVILALIPTGKKKKPYGGDSYDE